MIRYSITVTHPQKGEVYYAEGDRLEVADLAAALLSPKKSDNVLAENGCWDANNRIEIRPV